MLRNILYKSFTSELVNRSFSNSKRSSIIPFFKLNGENYYFFAIDRVHETIIDLGGTINYGENFLTSSIRELNEESIGIFNYTDLEKFVEENSITIYDDNNIFTFFEIIVDNPNDLCKKFRKKYKKLLEINETDPKFLENSHMIYISEDDLKNLCTNKKVKMPKYLHRVLKDSEIFSTSDEYPEIYEFIKGTLIKAFKGYNGIIT